MMVGGRNSCSLSMTWCLLAAPRPTQHEVARQLVRPGLVVAERGELQLENLEGVHGVAAAETLQIFLLEKEKLHFSLARRILQMGRQFLQHVDRPGPVPPGDAVAESGGGGLVQPAASLLHQYIRTGPQSHVTQVLPYQPHHLLVLLAQVRPPPHRPEEGGVHPAVGRGELPLLRLTALVRPRPGRTAGGGGTAAWLYLHRFLGSLLAGLPARTPRLPCPAVLSQQTAGHDCSCRSESSN